MKFLMNLFSDENMIIGLCGFENMKPKYIKAMENDFYLNHFQQKINFETNFTKNPLLL